MRCGTGLSVCGCGRQFNAMQASAEAYLNDVSQELAAGDVSGAVLDNLFAKHMRTPFDSFTTFISKYQSTMELFAGRGTTIIAHAPLPPSCCCFCNLPVVHSCCPLPCVFAEGVYEGGAGMGFGVNVLDCQGRPVLSMGAGIGFGFAATTSPESIYANISSGIGGGGGMTVLSYKSGGPEVVLNIGGGGGGGFCGLGSLTPNYGSSNDPNQTTIDLSSAYQTVALACTPLTISGSGGGGGGFVANDGPSTWADMNYGAGNQFSFGAAYSTGSTPSTSSGGTGDGQAIGKVYSSCRSSCQVGTQGLLLLERASGCSHLLCARAVLCVVRRVVCRAPDPAHVCWCVRVCGAVV